MGSGYKTIATPETQGGEYACVPDFPYLTAALHSVVGEVSGVWGRSKLS